jgi:hypothetical protein
MVLSIMSGIGYTVFVVYYSDGADVRSDVVDTYSGGGVVDSCSVDGDSDDVSCHPDSVDARSGDADCHPGGVVVRPDAVDVRSDDVDCHPGSVNVHSDDVSCHPGSVNGRSGDVNIRSDDDSRLYFNVLDENCTILLVFCLYYKGGGGNELIVYDYAVPSRSTLHTRPGGETSRYEALSFGKFVREKFMYIKKIF